MKSRTLHPHARSAGNVLILSILTIGVIAVTLAGYLALTRTHTQLTSRSQSWNLAMPLAEAGIEEAMSHLSYSGTNNLAITGWSQSGSKFTRTQTLGDGYYTVAISNIHPVTIISTGFARIPLTSNYNTRVIKATATATNGLWPGTLLATRRIDISKGGLIDSFDSSSSIYSTGGQYDPLKSKDGALIGSSHHSDNPDKTVRAVRFRDDTLVKGSLVLSPTGLAEIGSKAAVGSANWIKNKNTGIESGHLALDGNYDFPPVTPPFTSGTFMPSSGTVSGTNYQYVLGSGNYQLGSLDLNKKPGMIVTGNAVLYVTGKVTVSDDITILPGASLKLYVAGKTAVFEDGEIHAATASQFQYFGLPANKEVKIRKAADFKGAIYAPSAKFKLQNDNDFTGAVIARSVRLKGKGEIHYDEALKSVGAPFQGFRISSWLEQ